MKQLDVPDEELVACVLSGEGQAYETLITRYTNALSSIAFLMVRSVEDSRDIVQEAFVIAYCNLDQLEVPARFGAWIRGIVLNHCRKILDRRTRTQRFLERLPHTIEIPDPAAELAVRENARQALEALDMLDELHREVVMLYYFQDMKVEDIAQLVNKPGGTIKRILAEARGRLKEELIDMAREEFPEYHLTEGQKQRLEMIPVFPREEPKVTTNRLPENAERITIQAPYGNFPALQAGAESCYADYDYPRHRISKITHVRVQGPLDVNGKSALRYDNLVFSTDGKAEWIWRPYYRIDDGRVIYCAAQYGGLDSLTPLKTPDDLTWGEAQPQPESMEIAPGSIKEPIGDQSGYIVDENLWEVKIGRRTFQCIRRMTGGDRLVVEWSDTPVSGNATEEFFLTDGRMLLWRRYNGMIWGNPRRKKDAPGTYEGLADAGVPMLELFGEKYYLWYDQIPDYAIR